MTAAARSSAGRARDRSDRRSSCSGCWPSPRCCACPASRRAARGTATRATTCSSCARSSRTASCRCSGHRPRSATSTTAPGTTTCSAPAAFLTGGDSPLAVVALIALAGIAAVGVVVVAGARRSAGRSAGLVAGLLMARVGRRGRRVDVHLEPEPHRACRARSPWPATWRAWRGGSPRWWLLAAVGHGRHDAVPRPRRGAAAGRAVPLVLDARRRPLGRGRRRLGSSAIVVVAYLPLLDQRADDRRSPSSARRWTTSPAASRGRAGAARSGSSSSGCGSCAGRWSGSSRRRSCRPSWRPPRSSRIVGLALRARTSPADAGRALARARACCGRRCS